ncbi:hypothetical protein E6H29_06425 [Candidatus Bathyarchaeota archaeon]|nr:MAG: hypothetical protein E6H29_06425 [Candidatus Bathyarchaeota archaeon]
MPFRSCSTSSTGGAIAKLFATEATFEIARQALQVHGGIGCTKELPVERYFR